jgi:Radial spokehead-like protein
VIYIGWGQQRKATDYSPSGIPPFQDEFVDTEGGLVEMMDPSVELEEIWRRILEERRRAEEVEEEGGEEENGGEEVMA